MIGTRISNFVSPNVLEKLEEHPNIMRESFDGREVDSGLL
jgi:hypothetical protein